MKIPYGLLCALLGSSILIACGGGGGGGSTPAPTPTSHQVTISWAANREAAVNTTGGGYKIAVSGQSVIDVPYPSGTRTIITLMSGSYTATITAYSALNPSTGLSGASTSLPSTILSISVP
jgi:hypothetical protein